MCTAAACHTGGANVVQAEKTLQKDALVSYLDGGFSVDSIVKQASCTSHASTHCMQNFSIIDLISGYRKNFRTLRIPAFVVPSANEPATMLML